MSFGFSVGDFVAVAELAYQLSKALSESTGATKQYQELIAILNVVHKVLLQVEELRAANQLAQATVNALLFTVNTTNVTMETFLDQHAAYSKSLKPGGSGNSVNDIFMKGKWAIHMPDKASRHTTISDLQRSLGTMLAAINCLVSLACYYNTSYDARCRADLSPQILPPLDFNSPWQDIKVTARLSLPTFNNSLRPGFEVQSNPKAIFRPGQVFVAQITSGFMLHNYRTFRDIDFGNLPLEPVPRLKAMAEDDQLEDRSKRLAQIRRQLPLDKMTRYCEDVAGSREVHCILCSQRGRRSIYNKDEWATRHFREHHWRYYFAMIPGLPAHLTDTYRPQVIPWETQSQNLPQPLDPEFSQEKWIILDDVVLDTPIPDDEDLDIVSSFRSRLHQHGFPGPILIQRFVVIREYKDRCLALGIHTYARHGCGQQPDQELYGVLSAEKTVTPPPLQPDETRIILSPVRMKPDHPSLALPSTARIHYGRAYEIEHDVPIQPLGLIHAASMETLIDQFEEHVVKLSPEEKERRGRNRKSEEGQDAQAPVDPAEMGVVRNMRESITKVLGAELAPVKHQPPQATREQLHPPRPPLFPFVRKNLRDPRRKMDFGGSLSLSSSN